MNSKEYIKLYNLLTCPRCSKTVFELVHLRKTSLDKKGKIIFLKEKSGKKSCLSCLKHTDIPIGSYLDSILHLHKKREKQLISFKKGKNLNRCKKFNDLKSKS